MKTTYCYVIFFALLVSVVPSCVKKPVYPSEPVIEYKDFIRYGNPSDPDSTLLVISFTDNEGDIGLNQSDTNGLFKRGNLWMVYLYDSANNGNYIPFDDSITSPFFDTLKIPYRVPPVLPDNDPSEPMKGLIYIKQAPFTKIHDKIEYEIYLYDKAFHRSKKIRTPPIVF
jgi:hypothetical protein